MNAGARVIFQMGRRVLPRARGGRAHTTNETPHVAILDHVGAAVPDPDLHDDVRSWQVTDAFNDAGTFGAFGFLGGYFFVSVAAPMYLKKIGELKPLNVAMATIGVILLLVPAVGSVYPVPAPPVNLFPYLFVIYVLVGLALITARQLGHKLHLEPEDAVLAA